MNESNRITVNGFKDLVVYQKAFDLSILALRITRGFPQEFQYDLGSQMRRAAISIPSNITEGYRRRSRNEYLQFLYVAYGSCGELRTQTDIAIGMELIPENGSKQMIDLEEETSKILWAMIERMKYPLTTSGSR